MDQDPIFALSDECMTLSQAIRECLERERQALIEFRTEDLIEANHQKENHLAALARKRNDIKRALEARFGSLVPEMTADPEWCEIWKEKKVAWTSSWEALRKHAEENQEFLKHSLRNLDRLSENLKRLFGELTLYSSKGTRVDLKHEGNVVRVKY
jgi:FlgN protein